MSGARVEPVQLRDGDLLLRPWLPEDAAAVLAACQDPEIQRWTTVPVPYLPEHAAAFVTDSPARWGAGTPSFAAVDAVTGSLLGSFGVVGVSASGDAELGYWVAPAARGKGVATRATQLVCGWLFDQGTPRVVWHAVVGNVASRRVAEAAGFVVEGTARQGMVHRGERVDAWVASLLPHDLAHARAGAPRERTLLDGWPTEPVTIRTPRLLLRGYRDEDAPALLAYSNDPLVKEADPENLLDVDDALARVRRWGTWSGGTFAAWALADPVDDRLLGGVMLHSVDPQNAAAEVGYGVAAEARGRGLAAEAVRAVTDWGFGALALERIRLLHVVENTRSCRVAERAGFPLEGTTRQSFRIGQGRLHDEHVHARLPSDPHPSP